MKRQLVSLFLSLIFRVFVAVAMLGDPRLATPQVIAGESSATTPSVVESQAATARQRAWIAASMSERAKFAEQIGEDGARSFAKAQGFQPIFDGTSKSLPQGPDQVYHGADGAIHVLEAKGGNSPLGSAYGHRQGTSEWAVESADRILRSDQASKLEKVAAEAVLRSASKKQLEVHVIRTSHKLGEAAHFRRGTET